MIDYQHPIIKEMKEAYGEGNTAFEEARWQKNNRGKFGADPLKAAEAGQKLRAAEKKVSQLKTRMLAATDLPSDEREHYVPFIESHRANLEKWAREIGANSVRRKR